MSHKLLDAEFKPGVRLHREDIQLMLVCKEEDPPEQQECLPSLDQKDPPELPHIKEEQEEIWISQDGKQLQELEEADIKFTFTPAHVKNEDDEEKPQSAQLHERQSEHMKTEADGADCGGSQSARNFNLDSHLEPDTDDKTSDFSELETDDSDDWNSSRESQSGLNSLKNKRGCNTREKLFSCSKCSKQFRHNSNLKRHMRIHTGEKPFSCSVCSKRFTQKVHLTRHMVLHMGEKVFTYSVCDIRLHQLKNHQCVVHQFSQLHQSQTEENREAELLETEADGEDYGGSEPAKNLNPDSHLQLDSHDRTSHSSEPETDDSCDWEETREPTLGLNPLQNNEVPVSSMECNTGETSISSSENATCFGHEGPLPKHNGIQTGMKSFSCSVCGKPNDLKNSLTTHMRCHSEEKLFICSVCKKTFQRRGEVVMHMRVHTGEKPFSCSVCGKGFTQSSNLTSHLRVHTGEKPFTCSVCKSSFSERRALSNHMRTHTGEKPFSCSVCYKGFGDRGNLKRHMRIHTGEKPFRCSVCGKRFALQGSLRRHLTVHTEEKPFRCLVCGKGFGDGGNLRRHMRIHTGEKPFNCNACAKRFTRLHIFKKHKCAGESGASK